MIMDLKVCIGSYVYSYSGRGVERLVERVSEVLGKRGVNISVITSKVHPDNRRCDKIFIY